jgi:hypothetical protein
VQSLEKKWIFSSTSLAGICIKTCPDAGDVRVDPYTGDEYTADYDVCFPHRSHSLLLSLTVSPCGSLCLSLSLLQTVDVIGYCLNVFETRQSKVALDTFGDFIRAAGVIGVTGFVCSVIMCYLYLFFLRSLQPFSSQPDPPCRIPCMLTIMVWSNILLIEIGFILGAALLLSKASNEEDSDDTSRMSMTEVIPSLLASPQSLRDSLCRLNSFAGWDLSSQPSASSGSV